MEKKEKMGVENPMLKVMLIEDDATMVSLLTTLLDLEGFSVKAPANHLIDSIIDAIYEDRPQIALVDVNLSNSNGLDLVKRIREEPEINKTRILMSSGFNLQKECIQAGADGFLLKPFMPDELIQLIRSTVQ